MKRTSSKDYSELYKREIGKLENRFAGLLKDNKPDSLYEPCRYIITSGGKRLRPFLVLISARAVGGRFSQVYNAAIAVELLHNFTLVHDDIMDNATKRRGRPTLHIKYDLSTAILAGDNLIAIAYKSLLNDCKDNSKSIISRFTKGIIEVCEGQSLDKDFETKNHVSLREYKLMIKKKTAELAEMCCAIGAQLGGGNKEEISILASYGRNIGIAFQIQDDLLDIVGDENQVGKSVGGDLMEGKKTYLFLRALEKAEGVDKLLLERVIQRKGIRKNQINKYRQLYEKLGVLNDAEREIKRYTNKALRTIEGLSNEYGKDILFWLANVLISRNR
jgi:geranylgeranyl diphosphate synthase type II